jgi:UDP-glucose 4-epimerase
MLKTGARRPGDPPTQVLAVDNAAAVLGWRPTKTLADAVKDEACTWS